MAYRTYSSTRSGGSFDRSVIVAVWQKAAAIYGKNSQEVRKDACGKEIHFSDYGKTTTYGWEIDHVKPVDRGGSDDLMNLQPLHWQNNRGKSDSYPNWSCTLSG